MMKAVLQLIAWVAKMSSVEFMALEFEIMSAVPSESRRWSHELS